MQKLKSRHTYFTHTYAFSNTLSHWAHFVRFPIGREYNNRLTANEWVTAGQSCVDRGNRVWVARRATAAPRRHRRGNSNVVLLDNFIILNNCIIIWCNENRSTVRTHTCLHKLVNQIEHVNYNNDEKCNNGCKCVISLGTNIVIGWRSSSGRSLKSPNPPGVRK